MHSSSACENADFTNSVDELSQMDGLLSNFCNNDSQASFFNWGKQKQSLSIPVVDGDEADIDAQTYKKSSYLVSSMDENANLILDDSASLDPFIVPPIGPYVHGSSPYGTPLFFPKRLDIGKSKYARPIPNTAFSGSKYRPSIPLLFQKLQAIEEECCLSTRNRERPSNRYEHKLDACGTSELPLESSETLGQRHVLWTDKYRPGKFTELLSADKGNVEVLKWACQWKTSILPEKKILLISGAPGLGKTTLAHIVAKTGNFNLIEINASDERCGDQVQQKILSAISSDTILLSKKGGDAKSLPNLVVIDEIDGALNTASDHGLVKFLVQLANSTERAEQATKGKKKAVDGHGERRTNDESDKETFVSDKEEEESAAFRIKNDNINPTEHTSGFNKNRKQRKASFISILKRPIICICNDLYAPALKGLRAIAQVLVMKPPSSTFLAARLKTICDAENFRVDLRSLIDLSDFLQGDVRSCLNALQFLSRNHTTISGSGVLLKQLSMWKDMEKSNSSVWEIIFKKKRKFELSGKLLSQDQRDAENVDRDSLGFNTLAHALGQQDMEKILIGCFEIYPQVRIFDNIKLDRLNETLEWIGWSDRLTTHKFQQQHLSSGSDSQLEQYLPMIGVKIHQVMASNHPSIEWKYPRVAYEQYMLGQTKRSILNSYITGLVSPHNAHVRTWSAEGLRLERIPMLLSIIRPDMIKSSNLQLMRVEDRTKLEFLVRLLGDEGLAYRQSKVTFEDEPSVGGYGSFEYIHILEPPIDQLLMASGSHSRSLNAFKPSNHELAVRQLVASELEKELIQRKSRQLSNHLSNQGQDAGPKPNHNSVDIPRSDSPVEKKGRQPLNSVKRDFFGRPVKPTISQSDVTASTATKDIDRHCAEQCKLQEPVWFKYHEGFSNGVRKTVRMSFFTQFCLSKN